MTFIVRQIARTADGREIVRPQTFAAGPIGIGREADSDIHLPDLAVTLRHAEIREAGPGRIEIAATSGLPVDVNGRSTMRETIDVARGANIRIGSHMLTVAAGESDERGATIISVERVGALSEASEARDEQRAFSLAGVAPGRRATAWALAIAVLALFLAWPLWSFFTNHQPADGARREVAFHADQMWSSGRLSLAHANLENDCKACHVKPGEAVRDEACAACHGGVHGHADPLRLAVAKPQPGAGAKAQRAVAGMFGIPEGRCVACHVEHEGAKTMPVTEQRFCSDCHGGMDQRLTDTKVLNASDFGRDHPQFRPAVATNPGDRPIVQRLSLDARPLEDNGLKFPHDIHLAANGGVAAMARTMKVEQGFGDSLVCADCHVPDSTGARFQPVSMEKDCQMCHSLAFDRVGDTVRTLRHGDPRQVVADLRAFYRSTGPVAPINLDGMARRRPGEAMMLRTSAAFNQAAALRPARADQAIRAAFSEGGACFDCHAVTPPTSLAAADWGVVPVRLPQRYMAKGWFDHKSHAGESCESCHAARKSATAADVLLPGIATCRACHGGEDAAKAVPSSCAMCHDYHMDGQAPAMVRSMRGREAGARPWRGPQAAGGS
ncbi:cytochrome c3 family protein [Sphingomonas fennica]|uniref:Cytochrome C n=1 Tax=Edaphosphingomonas fennica TaxID=114404 RepID=A0A2T4I659_9SPHN|nr:cytochrome c3 family protein [Sphingomonas fennica]PTD26092.1 cytochrome C [Sphingomonas fennica]